MQDGGHPILAERSTSSQPLDDDDVRRLLAGVERVVIARGQKQIEVPANSVELDDLKGRSGRFRAPLLVSGGVLRVGFNEAIFSGF